MYKSIHPKLISISFYTIFKGIIFYLCLLAFINCSNRVVPEESIKQFNSEKNRINNKMNGVSMVAIGSPIDSSAYIPVTKINANWVSIIPFGFIPRSSATVQYNEKWQWYGEKKQGLIESIALAKEQELKVFLKPHLWIHDIWVGDLEFKTEKDWKSFEESYFNFIMEYGKIADSMEVELYCIGVELRKTVVPRMAFWRKLIDSVRTVYSGKITYAANWDNYEKVPFWNKLDYIGIDAYFPISKSKTPSLKECYAGWESTYSKIKAKSLAENIKVIFTEFGYRNIDSTGNKPWDDTGNGTFNTEGQNNAYQATFDRFWSESWFAGGFLWKWFPDHSNAGGLKNNRFTPQNKPVEKIISDFYGEGKL